MKLKANAKINLTLDIVGKREDGYHNISSVFQSVSLSDTVYIEKSDKITVYCDSIPSLPMQKNTAYKAAEAFFSYIGLKGGAEIKIIKSIPELSGLGGGSADAAAVIVGLNNLYGTNLSLEKLCFIGKSVGADVPFCIAGGTALVEGIGEKITPLKNLPYCFILILKSGKKQSTKDMYLKVDGADAISGNTEKAISEINKGNLSGICKHISNAFTPFSDCEKNFDILKSFSPCGVGLSGSGPSLFAIFDNKEQANSAFIKLKSDNYECYLCNTADCGIITE